MPSVTSVRDCSLCRVVRDCVLNPRYWWVSLLACAAHVINNAYGLQCSKICHSINEACRTGRVDYIVQSTDKNFLVNGVIDTGASPACEWMSVLQMCVFVLAGGWRLAAGSVQVPVGGAVIASPTADLVDRVSQMYPGRASIGPALDVFVTLLGMVRLRCVCMTVGYCRRRADVKIASTVAVAIRHVRGDSAS